jgi:hypothetical protein
LSHLYDNGCDRGPGFDMLRGKHSPVWVLDDVG